MRIQKNSWNDAVFRSSKEQHTEKFQDAIFRYTPSKKYIQLTEERNPDDIYYLQMHEIGFINPIISSLILDEQLSIVKQTPAYKYNLQDLLQNSQQSSEIQQLSYLKEKLELSEPSLDPMIYKKYPEISNFHIGRSGFGRSIQSYRIKSDAISRDHCQIVMKKRCLKLSQAYAEIISKALQYKTNLSSVCRKIPRDIMQKIFGYLKPQQKYLIRDLGSRNGTYIYEVGSKTVQLQPNYGYQIQGQSYSMYVKQIFTSADTPNESILKHNGRVSKMIDEFIKQVSWCYYESAHKSLLLYDKNIKDNDSGKFSVLVLKLKTKDPNQLYFISINQNQQKRFTIGCHQDIDIFPQQFQNPTLHALLNFKKGKWKLELPSNTIWQQNGDKGKKIWISPPKEAKFMLNTQNQYQIRLGNITKLMLEFKNF